MLRTALRRFTIARALAMVGQILLCQGQGGYRNVPLTANVREARRNADARMQFRPLHSDFIRVCFGPMQIRAVTGDDLADVLEIDGTVESSAYLHVETNVGDGIKASWLLEERKNRQKLIDPNRLGDDASFFLKQVVARVEEGLALTIEHEETPVALLLARPVAGNGTLRIIDLRVDYDYRRQGMGTALVYQ